MKRITIVLDEESLKKLEEFMVKERIFKYSAAIRKIINSYFTILEKYESMKSEKCENHKEEKYESMKEVMATEKQKKYLKVLAKKLAKLRGVSVEKLEEDFRINYETITKEEASELIDFFEALIKEESKQH